MEGDRLLRQARHDVHVAGWVLALEHAGWVAAAIARMPGIGAVTAAAFGRRRSLGARSGWPDPAGWTSPHEFLCTDPTGERVPVERFETVRPDVTIELCGGWGAM